MIKFIILLLIILNVLAVLITSPLIILEFIVKNLFKRYFNYRKQIELKL